MRSFHSRNNKMAEFSYGDDIAPLKGDFFGMRPLSQRSRDFLLEEDRAYRAKEREAEIAELNYQRAVFTFNKAREDSRRQKEEADHLGQLSEQLAEVTNSDMPTFDKVRSINAAKMELFSRNPLLASSAPTNGLFSSALNSVSGVEAERDRYLSQIQALAQLGDVKAVKELSEADGVVTEKEKGFAKIAAAHGRKAQAQQGSKRVQAEFTALNQDINLVRRLGDDEQAMPSGDEDVTVGDAFTLDTDERLQQDRVAKRHLSAEEFKKFATAFPDPATKKNYLLGLLGQKAAGYFERMYPTGDPATPTPTVWID